MLLPRYSLLLTALLAWLPGLAPGLTYTWDGSQSGMWAAAANWNAAPSQPLTDDTLSFPASASNKVMNQNLSPADAVVYRMIFNGSGYTLLGSALALKSTGPNPSLLVNHTSGTTRISVNLILQQNSGFSAVSGSTLGFAPNGSSGGSIDIASYTLLLDSAGTTEFSAVISGSGRVNYNGSGVVRFNQGYAQAYTGPSTVNAGTLVVNESLAGSSLTSAVLTTLAGRGSFITISTINGNVTPGDGGRGRLTFTRAVTLTNSSRLILELGQATNGGTTYDQLRCQNTVSLAGALTLTPVTGFNPQAGEVFTLINKTSMGAVTGTFAGLPQDSFVQVGGRTLQISYTGGDGNDVTLTLTGAPPAISSIADQTLPEDSDTAAISYTVSDPDTAEANLVVTIRSDNLDLLDPDTDLVSFGAGQATRGFFLSPAADQNGTANIAVTVSDGVNTASTTFKLTVTPVNDPPSFTAGPNQVTGPEPGERTVPGWATNLSPGPPDEADQLLSFKFNGNSNRDLFSVQPSISSTGTLTYTPAPGVSGTATLTIVLLDSASLNPSPESIFTITVNGALPVPDLKVTSFTFTPLAGGGQRIVLSTAGGPGAANRPVHLQASSTLASWETLTVATTGADGVADFDFEDTAAGTIRYYRTRIP